MRKIQYGNEKRMKRTKDTSKQILMTAACRLFVEKGIANVKVSDIAKESGIDASMINHHFGGREGLTDAVIRAALDQWKDCDIQHYYAENKGLLETRSGQKVFITGLVACVFRVLNHRNNPGNSLLMQLLQHPCDTRSRILEQHLKPVFHTFYEIYRKITGEDDADQALCWFMFLLCPQYVSAGNPELRDMIHPDGKLHASFEHRIQFVTTQILLTGLGLQ